MNVSFFIARRYLFSKKSHNVVNVISAISVCGIAVATAAIVCVLSIFNGFGGIVEGTFNAFDPDLKITVKEGKVFDYHTPEFEKALQINGIQIISESLEENALFMFGESQAPVLMKGVSEEFKLMTDMEKLLLEGSFNLREDVVDYTTLGSGLAMTLGARPGFINPIEIYAPKRDVRVNLANPAAAFTRAYIQIGGVFSLNSPEYDEQMAIVPIQLARDLFGYENQVTSLDIKLEPNVSVNRVKREIERILGDDFLVEDRYQQQKESYRMMQIEKWVTFLIMVFVLLIAVFNLVGSLSMLIVEKRDDIKSLQNMGASEQLISRIFLYEGWLISFIGIISGIITGLALCLLQQYFGLLQLSDTPGAYIIDAYPVIVKMTDVVIAFAVVSLISLLTVLYPVNNLRKKLQQ
ncbi:lipoprotein-releasing system permease protein [Porphyromonadaceae bacterium NLAE-zl-C104]|uniref:FtsX-like permease family protein n=1 Tax=Proteiniphilum sp. TaxID=1926877 RepID=UPI0008EA3548|nr:FtsX-like permease family protein [Proteiniphilum sp.]MDY9918209.1 FtsX-like permease family protein [Proteiniphilum sp.]SFS30115.1 lipoprotein-releasing system permease protein [Porphyromonadaceae bacterium NLAE-zl-C104]